MGLAQQMQFLMGILTTAIVLAARVSTGSEALSSPAILSAIAPIIGTIGSPANAPTPSASQQNGSSPQSSTVFPPSIEPSSPTFLQPPVPIRGPAPALSPSNHQEKEPITMNPTYPPATVASPSNLSPQFPPNIQPDKPGSQITPPAPTPTNGVNNPPSMMPFLPGAPRLIFPAPFMSPTTISPATHPVQSPFKPPVPKVPATSTSPPTINGKIDGTPIAASPTINPLPPNHPSPKSAAAPSSHKMIRHSKSATNPTSSPKSLPDIGYHSPASSPNISSLTPRYVRRNKTNQAQSPSTLPPSDKRAPLYPSKSHSGSAEGLHAPSQDHSDSSIPPSCSSHPSSSVHISHSQAPTVPSGKETMRHHSPKFSPSGSSPSNPRIPLPYDGLPPPPPNEECSSISCTEPLTYPVHGSPCVCVVPMQVGLRITVALYTFFPSVAEISGEIASGIFMRQSQVRIMGANVDSQDEEKTVVLIDLVPLEEKFDNTTAFLTYMRFWNKQIVLKSSLFGDYEVLYVHYPGLPASPPPSSGIINSVPNHGNNGRTIQPLGVDVSGQKHHKQGLSSSIITIIVLSTFLFLVLCSLVAWILLFKDRENREDPTPIASLLSASKPSGIGASIMGSMRSSASLSFGSSLAVYNGSAKGFSLTDIERATDNFNNSRILGEGGFGRVYSGVLEDGSKVAVKVLKRDDLQGGREFLAEVEMLSRLHHRNLVKLFGICTEENARCLVYELIPNGSLESHLHGVDKEASPLDWGARMKIALGAARGLAYLHEDSSPHVIHRDFKSSNILLEHDFTPKVSDFGLARAAIDEQDTHISTRVMGTFGYVAPEYAMTGHLLVKSDVYSYGVVLLELLTGRKPVDMSQPPGQENLVAWARPMLTTREGFQSIIDPFLGPDFPLDSIAKVVAIASMCVQPEVSNRPFMGEVVQALKLICNDRDDDPSEDCESIEMDAVRSSSNSDLLFNHFQHCHSPLSNYCSGLDSERGFTVSDSFDNSVRIGRQSTRALRVFSSSGPLRRGRRTREGLWQMLKKLSGGTMSEHGTVSRIWPPGSH